MRSLPTLLSYTKAIECSEGTILTNLKSEIVTNVGVQSFEGNSSSSISEKTERQQANIITSEKVYLGEEEDTLSVNYNLTIKGIEDEPIKCNNVEAFSILSKFGKELRKDREVIELYSKGLLYQILTGIYAERNRTMCSELKTQIEIEKEGEKELFEFEKNGRELKTYPFNLDKTNNFENELSEEDLEKFNYIAKKIADMLSLNQKSKSVLFLTINQKFKLTKGSIVYPSELFTEGNNFAVIKNRGYTYPGSKNANKIKLFYKTLSSNFEKFGYTPEKILNSLRRFDIWYTKEEPDFIGAIPFEPQGNVASFNKNFRNKNNTIFDYLQKIINLELEEVKKEELQEMFSIEERIFIFALIVRGGLFNSLGENK